MFSDIVGYTSMMQQDEVRTMAIINRFKQVHKDIANGFEGEILKLYGDGSLTIFDSVYKAVLCAIEIQRALRQDQVVPIRIGIHTGEVLFSDDDVYGDGINIASRIQALGVEGSILISDDIYDKVKNRQDIKSVFLGKHKLKNVLTPMRIYAIANENIKVPKLELKNRSVSIVDKNKPYNSIIRFSKKYAWFIVIFLIAAGILVVGLYIKSKKEKEIAKAKIIPSLEEDIQKMNAIEGQKNWEVYGKMLNLKKDLSRNSEFIGLWNSFISPVTLTTNIKGADVYAKSYLNPDTSWLYLGKTPISLYPFPQGLSRLKIELSGYEPISDVVLIAPVSISYNDTLIYHLFKKDDIRPGMVFIPGAMGNYYRTPFLPQIYVGDFWMDQYEVTNAEFKIFIESGGYEKKEYWDLPFIENEDTIPFELAMERFVDKTGWMGPAGWEFGDFPEGNDEMPVSGISWYEAAAYAKFKKKDLPTLFHWFMVSEAHASPEIVKMGNFDRSGPAIKGSFNSLTRYGIYDLPGNVSEWVYNANQEKRFVMGGNYNEPTYWYSTTMIQVSPWKRSELVGFRCIKYFEDTLRHELAQNFDRINRDYNHLQPISEEVFAIYKEFLKFERAPMNPSVISRNREESWIQETIQVNVPYEDKPMHIQVFLPLNSKPPYQTIIFFPGLNSHFSSSIEDMQLDNRSDFLLKSGRAFVWPAYYASHGRGEINVSNLNLWKQNYRHIITDFQVTVDYLETRSDIDTSRLAYMGYSWGGGVAPYILAIEKRIKTGMLFLFGVTPVERYTMKEFDQVDYLPRVKIPMLLLGGRYDFDYTIEQQQAFYDLLGTADKDKKWILCESTHFIPRNIQVKESTDWLDEQFGPVEFISR